VTDREIIEVHTAMLFHLDLAIMGSMIAGDPEAEPAQCEWARETAERHYEAVVSLTRRLCAAGVPAP
jgi:hypothetical protein